MNNVELERRLRSAAAAYERLAPAIPDLDRHIFSRIAATPRTEHGGPSRNLLGHRSLPIQLLAALALVAFAVAVAVLIREARLFRQTEPVILRSADKA